MARLLQNRASRLGLAQGNGFFPDEVLMGFIVLLIPFVVIMMVVTVRRGAGRSRGGGRGVRGNNYGGGDSGGRGSWSSARASAGRGSRGERDDGGFNELSDFFERADRSISNGDYPNAPLPGQPKLGVVTFTEKYINNPRHKKTLKGIVRNHWPTGPVDSLGRPRRTYFDCKWYSDVLTIFDTYYDYEEGMTEEDAHAKVKAHLSSNMRQLLFHERKKANERVAASQRGTTRRDVRPPYVDPPIWDSLCDWWESAKFKSMSDQNKINRGTYDVIHTTGAKPYIIFRKELEKVKDRPVTHVEFFEATHKSDFWTPAAQRMKDVLVKLWDEYRDSQSQGGGDESEAGTSSPPIIPLSPTKRRRLEADIVFKASKELGTTAHLKNRILMEGREKLIDIYGTDVPSTGRIMTSRSESARLSDELLQQAIGNAAVIAHAKENLSYVPRSELDVDIQHLAVDVIPHDHAQFAEYVRIASMAVTKILGTNGKTILEDDTHSDHGEGDGEGSGHGDIPDISEDEMMA
ncbi:hypothetical protein POM88_034486 [Heracleum sosnowskyi]|uniref:Uncharacterized protein n=1 Tax=Heracleum sosnowskyi TaxID=360622 RepID=A0AAD8HJN7_9APIA|nr:hypothetical protein POM88_034486 [Heracleum sosnowskyi]